MIAVLLSSERIASERRFWLQQPDHAPWLDVLQAGWAGLFAMAEMLSRTRSSAP